MTNRREVIKVAFGVRLFWTFLKIHFLDDWLVLLYGVNAIVFHLIWSEYHGWRVLVCVMNMSTHFRTENDCASHLWRICLERDHAIERSNDLISDYQSRLNIITATLCLDRATLTDQ